MPMLYSTIIFDCDGVILDSNRVKTEAFRQAASSYGAQAAEELVRYHVTHGGVSRYQKFEHFLQAIVPPDSSGPGLPELLNVYATIVRESLLACRVTQGLERLRSESPGVRWLIASGGDQMELREIFSHRGLDHYFDGGIFGSPDTKHAIVSRERENGNIRFPALFLGDSRYDHEVAKQAGCDFLFISGWTEFSEWRQYAKLHSLHTVENVIAAVNFIRGDN